MSNDCKCSTFTSNRLEFWPTTCAFEGLNGCVLNNINDTQHIELQIAELIYKSQMLPQMIQNILETGDESMAIYQ